MIYNDLNVALFPMPITWGDKNTNIECLEKGLSEIHPDTDIVIIPETFSTGFPSGVTDKEKIRPLAERNTGTTIDIIKRLANKYSVAIAGSFIADSGGLLYNRAFVIEPGEDETFADKRHLFTMAGEDKIFSAGTNRLQMRYRGWNIAMVVCYDIRFPVWCRNKNNEYDLLIAVANWPKVRVDAWNQLVKSRAIENEAYVCAVNCKGIDSKGFEYDGASHVIDFKGKEIAVAGESNKFMYAILQRDKLNRFREKFPAWKDADEFTIL
jgi:predicted amidohydrolase